MKRYGRDLPPDQRNRMASARKALGIAPGQMEGVAQIGPLLRRAGVTKARAVEILEGDDSSEARAFLGVYRRLGKFDRKRLSVEEIAVAAGLTTRRLWETICGAAMQLERDVVSLMVAVAQPEAVARTIKTAKTAQGYRDREHLYKSTGFLPAPKGSQIFVNLGRPEEKEPEKAAGTGHLPSMDQYLLDIQRAISPSETLPGPVPKVEDAKFAELPTRLVPGNEKR